MFNQLVYHKTYTINAFMGWMFKHCFFFAKQTSFFFSLIFLYLKVILFLKYLTDDDYFCRYLCSCWPPSPASVSWPSSSRSRLQRCASAMCALLPAWGGLWDCFSVSYHCPMGLILVMPSLERLVRDIQIYYMF